MLRHGSLQQLSGTLRHSIRAGTAPSPLPNFFNSALRGFGDVASASAASAASPAASAHPLTHRLRDAARVYKQLSKVRIKQPQKCLSILHCCVQYCLQSACRPEPAMLDTGEHSKTHAICRPVSAPWGARQPVLALWLPVGIAPTGESWAGQLWARWVPPQLPML